jgi:cell division GTPase FtsZ
VKPDGRSLDISVIGLGQAGGNMASEFFRRGYRALALNTAQTDLAALDPGGVYPAMPPERRIYVGLDGYDGAGSDPAYGKQCILENGDRIRAAIVKQAAQSDVVLLTAGLGGGTGSALFELIKLLEAEQLPLIALMTLPTEGESGIAKVNAVRAINELVDAPLLGWIFVDNARIAKLNPDISVVDYYSHINGQIAAPIDALNRLNDREALRAIRSFDGEDLRKLLLSGGVLNYAVTEVPSITTEEVVGTIRDSVEASELMPGGFEMSKLSYLGIVIEATEPVLAATPISVFEDIDEHLKAETEGGAVYHGIYRSSEDQPTTVRLICATQSMPHRIRQILADAKREGMVIGEKIREELPTLELGEIESVELFRTNPSNRPTDRRRRSQAPQRRDGIDPLEATAGLDLDRVPGPEPATEDGIRRRDLKPEPQRAIDPRIVRRRPNKPRESSPASRSPSPQLAKQPSAKVKAAALDEDDSVETDGNGPELLGTEEIDIVAQLAEAEQKVEAKDVTADSNNERPPPPVPGGGDLPNPEIYDRLVTEYRQAKQPRVREEVQRRLEKDSLSEHTVVRYYAVEAMSKLGRDVFGNALLAATEDENEAVRAIAVEALRR